MPNLIATDRENVEHTIEAREGLSLMEILKDSGLEIEAICGGQCVCSTCHIYVEEKRLHQLGKPSEEERIMVEDTGHYRNNSRLSCQIIWNEGLDGIRLALAPEF